VLSIQKNKLIKMKLLESGRLEAMSSILSRLEVGEFRITGRLESYSCKVIKIL
jgi:hypothetical protein